MILKLKFISLKISVVGKNVIFVPVKYLSLTFLEAPIIFNSFVTIPLLNSKLYIFPSLLISNIKFSDKAFTTDTPTPCKPPDTL